MRRVVDWNGCGCLVNERKMHVRDQHFCAHNCCVDNVGIANTTVKNEFELSNKLIFRCEEVLLYTYVRVFIAYRYVPYTNLIVICSKELVIGSLR